MRLQRGRASRYAICDPSERLPSAENPGVQGLVEITEHRRAKTVALSGTGPLFARIFL